jgi:ABC-type glutathione transport system ATPase component
LANVFITHDPGVVATVADRVLILDAGSICEAGTTTQVLNAPQHDYTRRLLDAAPSLSLTVAAWRGDKTAADGASRDPGLT